MHQYKAENARPNPRSTINSYRSFGYNLSTAIADITLFKKEFRVNLNDHANITAKWKDGVSLMYNLKLGVN